MRSAPAVRMMKPSPSGMEVHEEALQALALGGVADALGDGDAGSARGEDEVAPRQADIHADGGALRVDGVADDLDEDLLSALDAVLDLARLAQRALLAALLVVGDRAGDLAGVEEGVLVDPDVHERGLEAGVDVLDLALVDVADERLLGLALDVVLLEDAVVEDRDADLLGLEGVDEHAP